MVLLNLLSTVLFSAGLSSIFSRLLISKFDVNFFGGQFSLNIPSFTPELALDKTYDILYVSLLLLFSFVIFLVYRFFLDFKEKDISVPDLANLVFAFFFFFQIHFVRHSGSEALVFFMFTQILYIWLRKKSLGKKFSGWVVWANGFLLGFVFMLLVRRFTTSMLVTFGTVILTVEFYQLLGKTRLKTALESPFHLLLFLAIFFSWNAYVLLILIGLTLIGLKYLRNYPKFVMHNQNLIYSLAFIILLVYNPTFYFGNLDSVEEGFWLGWLQRLLSGQVLYRDVVVYYPPLIPWTLNIFVRTFGINVYTARLYFQILKVIGIVLIYLSSRNLVNKKLNLVLVMVLFFSFLTPLVRNNVEIRMGVGLASLYLFSKSFNGNRKWLIFSGVISSLALFISIETGVASLVAIAVGFFLFPLKLKDIFKKFTYFVLGFSIPTAVVVGILYTQTALKDFFQQTFFYSKAFASGYFNIGFEKVDLENIFMFWRVNRFLHNLSGAWELVLLSTAFVLIFLVATVMNKKVNVGSLYAILVLVFNMVLLRAALGRSDWYHLLFVLINAVALLTFVLENIKESLSYKNISTFVLLFIIIVMFRTQVSEVFINEQLIKFQSYANVPQRFNILQTTRAGIALDIDSPVDTTNALIKYIVDRASNTDKIFVYPWRPELYFLTDRNNATKFDTPYSSFAGFYQEEMVVQLKSNRPKYLIYNPNMNFASMTPSSLLIVKDFIERNYEVAESFGDDKVMTPKY